MCMKMQKYVSFNKIMILIIFFVHCVLENKLQIYSRTLYFGPDWSYLKPCRGQSDDLIKKRVVIWLWVDALAYKISKNQLPRSKTVASSHKKVHFWNPIWRTPSALWNGPSPISLSFLIWSRWDLVCQSTLGSSWLVPNLIKFSKELAEI